MEKDIELETMNKAWEVLSKLDDEQKIRFLHWYSSKIKYKMTKKLKIDPIVMKDPSSDLEEVNFNIFNNIADLFNSIDLKSEKERVLMAASFIQIKYNKNELRSRDVRDALRGVNIYILNITRVMKGLNDFFPLIEILDKEEGGLEQKHYLYRVTPEGIKEAKKLFLDTLKDNNSNIFK